MVVLDLEDLLGDAPALVELPLGAKVDHGGEAEAGQLGAVVLVEPGEPVSTEELPPPDAAPIGTRISPEVTEVDATRQCEFAEWLGERVGHRAEISGRVSGRARRPPPRRPTAACPTAAWWREEGSPRRSTTRSSRPRNTKG